MYINFEQFHRAIIEKKIVAKLQVLQIQEKIILNNLYNLINYDFKKVIYNDIFYKYTSKNIGEKTKEKIAKSDRKEKNTKSKNSRIHQKVKPKENCRQKSELKQSTPKSK